ncbi:MAG: hypothetical protein EOM10_18070 [Opitutae bacterium]|nr:hypothetical protein [Opitutae bacterium]
MTSETVLALRVPTRMAVTKLETHFADLQQGRRISWGEIEEVVGELKESNRFKHVTNAWRRILLQEQNILLSAIGNGFGLVVADAKRRIDESTSRVERGRNQIAKALFIAYNTDPAALAEGDRARRERVLALDRGNNALIRLTTGCRRELPAGEAGRAPIVSLREEGTA